MIKPCPHEHNGFWVSKGRANDRHLESAGHWRVPYTLALCLSMPALFQANDLVTGLYTNGSI